MTSEKSPLGSHKSVSCTVTIMKHGQPITHLIAPGSVVRIDPPRGKQMAASGGARP